MELTQVFITQEISVSEKTKSKTIDDLQSLENIIADIKSNKHQAVIELIRKSDKEKRTEIKNTRLPRFFPCVYLPDYTKLETNNTFHATGIIQFDVDNLSADETINFKEQLIDIPELLYAFTSPSNGLKFGLATDFDSKNTETLTHLRDFFSLSP